jgi:hypothetical protein
MKRLIIGVAALGALGLLGCKTETAAGGSSSEVSQPTRIAQSPDIARGDNGPLIPGTVVGDYRDTLVIRDDSGFQRSMRVDDQTLFRDADGAIIARTYLAPGAQVRTSFDYNNSERIAREVVIVNDKTQCEPNSWPEESSPYRPNP